MGYTGRWFTRTRIYVCGDYLDAAVYPVFQPAGKRRKKCRPTTEVQARLNQRNAEKKLTRLVHANFTANDLTLHLTYRTGEEPADASSAARTLNNFLRRLKRRYQAQGRELRYIACTELGARNGRCHHHLILSGGISRDEIEATWGHGYANSRRLQFGPQGVAGLAVYMAKEGKTTKKRWCRSRNLITPEPMEVDGMRAGDVKALAEAIEEKRAAPVLEALYPDFELTEAVQEKNGINHGLYITYTMRRLPEMRHATRARGHMRA